MVLIHLGRGDTKRESELTRTVSRMTRQVRFDRERLPSCQLLANDPPTQVRPAVVAPARLVTPSPFLLICVRGQCEMSCGVTEDAPQQ